MFVFGLNVSVRQIKFLRDANLKMSISATFYGQLFDTKVFFTAFLYLQFGFVIIW